MAFAALGRTTTTALIMQAILPKRRESYSPRMIPASASVVSCRWSLRGNSDIGCSATRWNWNGLLRHPVSGGFDIETLDCSFSGVRRALEIQFGQVD